MYTGIGIKNIIGIKPIVTRMTNDAIDTGIVSRAIKSIIETYVSGYILILAFSSVLLNA